MSINWSDTSFLQMIAGVHLNPGFSLSSLSAKSQSEFNGQKSILPNAYFKVKFSYHLNEAKSAKMSGLFCNITNRA